MQHSLPGIRAISYLPCSLLAPHIIEKYRAGLPIAVFSPSTPIEHYGDASCIAESEYTNGGYYEKTTLSCTTTDTIPQSVPIAFVVTDVADHSFLIGCREAPIPIVEITKQIDKESNIFEVKVTFQREKSLIECSV